MQSPHTASPQTSIWSLVGRDKFENNVASLRRVNTVPGTSHVYSISDRLVHAARSYDFPIDVERELADDLAFVAAYEEGVRTVTAAAIDISSSNVKVVLAANEGIDDVVQSAFHDIFHSLEACAHGDIARRYCASAIFDIVVNPNRNRIYGRLGSSKFHPPMHRRMQTSETLPLQMDTLIHKASRVSSSGLEFDSEMRLLHDKFRDLEGLDSPNDHAALLSLLEHIYRMTIDGISFPRRLQSLGCGSRQIESKQVRQFMKLANYKRICDSLAEKARSFRLLFENLTLQTLSPFAPANWRGEKRFVHAEVQIVVHYVKSKPHRFPRVIGASKEACFLCDCFVRAHGQYQLSRAHRQLFHLWTVPDLREYDSLDLSHIRRCMEVVNQDLIEARLMSAQRRRRRPFPLQSSINLIKAVVRSASMSTIRSLSKPMASVPSMPGVSLASHTSTAHNFPQQSQSSLENNDSGRSEEASSTVSSLGLLVEDVREIQSDGPVAPTALAHPSPSLRCIGNDTESSSLAQADGTMMYDMADMSSGSNILCNAEYLQPPVSRPQSGTLLLSCESEKTRMRSTVNPLIDRVELDHREEMLKDGAEPPLCLIKTTQNPDVVLIG